MATSRPAPQMAERQAAWPMTRPLRAPVASVRNEGVPSTGEPRAASATWTEARSRRRDSRWTAQGARSGPPDGGRSMGNGSTFNSRALPAKTILSYSGSDGDSRSRRGQSFAGAPAIVTRQRRAAAACRQDARCAAARSASAGGRCGQPDMISRPTAARCAAMAHGDCCGR